MLKDLIPADIEAFIANCENADILRFINQKLLMPKLKDIYRQRIATYSEKLQWGDVIFAPWGDGKSYAGMVWEVLDGHSVRAFFFDEGSMAKPKLHSVEVQSVSAVAYLAEIDGSTLNEAEWKDAATSAIFEARDLILDSDPVFPEDFVAFLAGLYATATEGE